MGLGREKMLGAWLTAAVKLGVGVYFKGWRRGRKGEEGRGQELCGAGRCRNNPWVLLPTTPPKPLRPHVRECHLLSPHSAHRQAGRKFQAVIKATWVSKPNSLLPPAGADLLAMKTSEKESNNN